MHRDIKPANVMLSHNGCVKLLDFGLAETSTRYHHGATGTPYYMAPEVIDKAYKELCDVWSVGVLSFYLLTGYRPFEGDSPEEVLQKIESGRVIFPEGVELSNEAKDFVLQLLVKDPE